MESLAEALHKSNDLIDAYVSGIHSVIPYLKSRGKKSIVARFLYCEEILKAEQADIQSRLRLMGEIK